MADDDESYCDCADELDERLRSKARTSQYPETTGWAALFGPGSDSPSNETVIPSNEEDKRCTSKCGPNVDEPSRCGRGGYRAVDNDADESVYVANQRGFGADQGGYGSNQGAYGAGQGYGPGQGGYGSGQGAHGSGQGFGPGQGGYGSGQGFGPGQGGYGSDQGAYGARQGHGPGQGGTGQRYGSKQGGYGPGRGGHGAGSEQGYGPGPGVHGAGPRGGTGKGIHRAGQVGFHVGTKGAAASSANAGDGMMGRVVGGSKRKTVSDILIPLIGGGLVFLAIVTSLYRYFNVGTVVKSKVKTFTTQVMNQLCEPIPGRIISGFGASMAGSGKAAGAGAGSGAGFGGAGAAGKKECSDSFAVNSQTPRRKGPVCGKEKIDPNKRKFPLPPPPFNFPVVPGLHECTDDEENEEGVFVAPSPFED